MSQKIIRDPIYDYISFDIPQDQWALDLLDTPEIQRLRFIHQLGVSSYTYPGASHSRLSHSLGVFHLMQMALRHLREYIEQDDGVVRKTLLGAAIVHDVGHGPFSHLLEGQLGQKHEKWTTEIINCPGLKINQILQNKGILEQVSALIEKDNFSQPHWQKSLISSQLDVDRMDYLLRDSHFLGTGYGRFDWFRIINTMRLLNNPRAKELYPVWPEKTMLAIEEYIFARFYMYQSVYFHKCTRGYECLLHAIWDRAVALVDDGTKLNAIEPLDKFLASGKPTVENYLRLGESHILVQIDKWKNAKDTILSNFCQMFLQRRGFGAIDIPISEDPFAGYEVHDRENQAKDYLRKKGFTQAEYYLLQDKGQLGIYKPYQPTKYSESQEPSTAIFLEGFREISNVLKRLKTITEDKNPFMRYYCPKEHKDKIKQILTGQ